MVRCKMATSNTTAKTSKAKGGFRRPDRPERESDNMTSFNRLAENGNAHHLKQHLMARRPFKSETVIVSCEHYLVVRSTRSMAGSQYHDLPAAFGVDPADYRGTNGYVIAEHGKPSSRRLRLLTEQPAQHCQRGACCQWSPGPRKR